MVRKPSDGGQSTHDHVVAVGDRSEGLVHTGEEHLASAVATHQRPRRLVLELHKFEIAGHQIEVGEVSLADDVGQAPALVVVADGTVESLVLADVELRLKAVHGRQAGLRIEVDREHPVAAKRQVLGEMGGGGGLAAAALEIDDGYDLKLVVRAAPRQVADFAFAVRVEIGTDLLQILGGVEAAADAVGIHRGPLPCQGQAAEITVIDPDQPGGFAGREFAERLLCGRRENLLPVGLQPG